MRRVLVIGCSGSGKTTLARKIARERGLPWVSLDSLFWQPGWVESTDEEFFPKVEEWCAKDAWVIDGTFSRTLHIRLPRTDTVIWLDFPRRTCLWGVTRRWLANYRPALFGGSRTRPEMPAGCAEKIDWEFIQWIWNYRRTHDHKNLATLTEWLGREPVRGECTVSELTNDSGTPRHVWWLANRRDFALPDGRAPSRSEPDEGTARECADGSVNFVDSGLTCCRPLPRSQLREQEVTDRR